MPRGTETVVTLETRIPEVIAVTEAETQGATQDTARFVVEEAKRRSRVESGAMRQGWQTRRAPEAKTYVVFNPVPWTIFNEFGTTNMPAQPMLGPAVELGREHFKDDVAHIWQQVATGGIGGSLSSARTLGSIEAKVPAGALARTGPGYYL